MDSPDRKEVESLLREASSEVDLRHVKRKTSKTHLYHLTFLYIFIIVLICTIVFPRPKQVQHLYSPASSAATYRNVLFYDNIHHISPYQGPPNDDKDYLWEALYNNASGSLITPDEASKMPNRTMPVPGFDGQSIVVLEVFHQLHCLNTLRKSLYPSRFPAYAVFFPNGTRNEAVSTHHEHCIDRIRQGISCASNIGSVYYRWREDLQVWAPEMGNVHECRDFERIQLWAASRQFTPWQGWDEQKPVQKEF